MENPQSSPWVSIPVVMDDSMTTQAPDAGATMETEEAKSVAAYSNGYVYIWVNHGIMLNFREIIPKWP